MNLMMVRARLKEENVAEAQAATQKVISALDQADRQAHKSECLFIVRGANCRHWARVPQSWEAVVVGARQYLCQERTLRRSSSCHREHRS
jgi:hypothetical protein